jgi:acyl-CoA thioester hydrolase
MDKVAEASKEKTVQVPIIIRFGDTDPYGVVYFVSYFRYCHHGIEEFFRCLGLAPQALFRNQKEGFGLPIVGATCDFYRPVWYGEELRLEVYIVKVGKKSVTFGFRFYHTRDGHLVAQGKASIVTIDKNWQSRALPESLRCALESFLSTD